MIPWSLFAEQPHADTGWDILARLVDSLPALLTAAAAGAVSIFIAQRGQARHEETKAEVEKQAATIEEIRESTVNSHARPMRYDIDDIAAAVDEVKSLAERIGAEVREDRAARRDGDMALTERLEEISARVETSIAKHHPEDAS